MPEEPTTPVADPETPTKTEEPAQEPTPTEPPKEVWDEERARKTIEAQREAEKKLKAEVKNLKARAAKLDEIEAAQLSEQQKLEKERDEALAKGDSAQSKLQQAHLLVALAAPELGIVSPKAAAKLIDGVEFNEDGEPTNLGDPADENSLIGKFLSDHEFLKGKPTPSPAPSTDGGEGGDGTPPNLTAEEIKFAESMGMTPEEYAKNK